MTARKPIGVQADCFDMWHDYMNLGRLLRDVCYRREAEPRDNEDASKDLGAPWGPIPAWRGPDDTASSTPTSPSDCSSTGASSDYCSLCKQNRESPRVYRSHRLKSNDGKVICPVLRSYTCPVCKSTGDHAHTLRYCPTAQKQKEAGTPPVSRFW
ncbi:nanos homolog 1-like [Betta splendens]|uniref:Nanos homolog 1-like n=1 Tax=Betta splendens TaxID=158456 RepID=A0A6P7MES2_BETSP|nr:nanos homolog 1-like [Betta splendens]